MEYISNPHKYWIQGESFGRPQTFGSDPTDFWSTVDGLLGREKRYLVIISKNRWANLCVSKFGIEQTAKLSHL